MLVTGFEQLSDRDPLLTTLQVIGDRLTGVIFNGVRNAAFYRLELDAIPFLEKCGGPVFGVLPHDPSLAGMIAIAVLMLLNVLIMTARREMMTW